MDRKFPNRFWYFRADNPRNYGNYMVFEVYRLSLCRDSKTIDGDDVMKSKSVRVCSR